MNCTCAPQHGSGEVKKYKVGDAPVVLLQPELVARQQEDRLLRQAAQHLVHRSRTGKSTKVDTLPYDEDIPAPASWSPDSKWLAYSHQLKNYQNAVFLYSLEAEKAHQITDGMSDARYVAFDKRRQAPVLHGQHRHRPVASARACRSSIGRSPVRVYVVVLSKDDPIAARAGKRRREREEGRRQGQGQGQRQGQERRGQGSAQGQNRSRGHRSANARAADPGQELPRAGRRQEGPIFLVEGPAVFPIEDDGDAPPAATVIRFDMEKRKPEKTGRGAAAIRRLG